MPPEPKRPIEDLLEQSAKARRAEFCPDPSMPNPMRARLHEEIARCDRREGVQPRRAWLAMFWPQISIATAVAAVLVTGGVLWLGHKSDSGHKTMQLAMKKRAGADVAATAEDSIRSFDAAPQIAMAGAAAQPSEAIAETASGRLADAVATLKSPSEPEVRQEANAPEMQKFADVAIAPAAPAAAAIQRATRDLEESSIVRTDKRDRDVGAATTAPAERFAAKSAAPADAAKDRKMEMSNVQQQFSQTTRGQALRNNVKAKQTVNILDNFQVEQNGREIRVVDADGSTYTGKFEATAPDGASRMAKQKQSAAAPASAASGVIGGAEKKSDSLPNEQFFRASGFNSSLKKRVVFEGNYIPLPVEAGKKTAKAKQWNNEQQAPARIVGTAKVPGESPVEVDATTVAQ